jgi:fido (protein-threonine AMPylation protein)
VVHMDSMRTMRVLAYRWMPTKNALLWRIGGIRMVHLGIFGRVHPWAGRFRKPGQVTCIKGHLGADSAVTFLKMGHEVVKTSLLKIELVRLESQAAWMLAHLWDSHLATLILVAVFHLRFIRIHPFVDGNGRVGRTLMMLQLAACGMHSTEAGMRGMGASRDAYIEALRAGDRGDIAPMINWCAAVTGLYFRPTVSSLPSPFRISPEMETDSPLPPDDYRWEMPEQEWLALFRAALAAAPPPTKL